MVSSDAPSPLVRPFALTQGRTKPTRAYPMEALVHASPGAGDRPAGSPEKTAIVTLCARSLSVAEVAAHLHLPLGVVRVLIGDLVDAGAIEIKTKTNDTSPNAQLLQRVLGGLRKL
ncbi:MAG: DUF742 domain-containing protein [Nocardioides sp.]